LIFLRLPDFFLLPISAEDSDIIGSTPGRYNAYRFSIVYICVVLGGLFCFLRLVLDLLGVHCTLEQPPKGAVGRNDYTILEFGVTAKVCHRRG